MASEPTTDRDEQRLEDLEDRIEEVRDQVDDDVEDGREKQRFIDPGTIRRDEVNDAIVPPG